MLPTIVMFIDGIAFDRIVGFEELGGEDEFPTMLLTRRLIKCGVIGAKNEVEGGKQKMNKVRRRVDSDDY